MTEPATASAADAVERAAALLSSGPATSWSAPSRFGRPGLLARRLLQRAMRPYAVRQGQLDHALLGAVRATADQRVTALEAGAGVLAHAAPIEADAVVEADTAAGRLWLSAADSLMTPFIQEHGIWEAEVTAYLQRTLRPGMTVVDVGANVGYFSVLAARLVGPTGLVVAVEPAPSNAAVLRANLWRHGCANAVVLPIAAYSETGHLQIVLPPEGGSGTWLETGEVAGTLVPCAPLDDLLGGRRVDVVKTDAEGTDHHVLQGLRTTLARSPSARVVAEFVLATGRMGDTPADVLALYRGMGFAVRLLGPDGVPRAATQEEILAVPSNITTVVLEPTGR
jgi:FkbM family methyltransferase